MNVAGFDDALRSAVRLKIDDDLLLRVASIPGLTILKLLAWSDRGRGDNRDASDLYTLFSTYADAGNIDRLYEDEADLLETAEFDVALAGAQLLGRDVARVSGGAVSRRLIEILDGAQSAADLVSQMSQVRDPFGERPDLALRLMESFRRGVADVTHNQPPVSREGMTEK
jgi:predicted nucleotidyltransferase